MKNLRKLRTERNLSQQKLADAVGVSQQSINKYENGLAQPDLQMLMQLASFFHTSIDYLIGYADNPNTYKLADDESAGSLIRETPAFDPENLYDTSPRERHHLSMYRRLKPEMQNSLDDFLENFSPDNHYKKFQNKKS